MDYIEKKKLWDEVQHMPFYDNRDRDAIEDLILSIPCVNIATAIETLLAEQEAAIQSIPRSRRRVEERSGKNGRTL